MANTAREREREGRGLGRKRKRERKSRRDWEGSKNPDRPLVMGFMLFSSSLPDPGRLGIWAGKEGGRKEGKEGGKKEREEGQRKGGRKVNVVFQTWEKNICIRRQMEHWVKNHKGE